MLLYSQSHHNSRLQKLLSIYLKFKGITAKGFDTLHAVGLVMSHKWTCDSVRRISETCMAEVQELMQTKPWLWSYDNLSIAMRMFVQRVDKESTYRDGAGSAATVYVKRLAKPLSETANSDLKAKRAEGLKNPLTGLNIVDLVVASSEHLEKQAEYEVLRVLLESPEFDFKTYKDRKSDLLEPPAPLNPLATGHDHITLQYLLGSVNKTEASIEDNAQLVLEWMEQVGLGSDEEKRKTGMERVITWVGDQLTVNRLRTLYQYRAEDSNSFDRLDYSVFVFGWFHCQMAFANSLHKQYLGTTQGRGLKHAFTLLNRKGLDQVLTQGPFHHDLDDVLHQIAAAHFREDWLAIGNVKDLAELWQKRPEDLAQFARKILEQHASNAALDRHDRRPEEQQDQAYRQLILWNRDVLQYIILNHAIKEGDIGLIELMLPHLYVCFVGGGNGHYAVEILELLQGLHREWPEEIW